MAGPELERYRSKRHFEGTPEPPGDLAATQQGDRWVVQQHAARRMHYDFRLEADGVLISWAVPKGPSYDPRAKRLAVKVEDHPLEYRDFEGRIPKGNYGAGSVIVWDEGTYRNLTTRDGLAVPVTQAVAAGHVSVWLEGKKLVGGWSLTRFDGDNWALVKRADDHADAARDVTGTETGSVKSGLTVQEVGRRPPPATSGAAVGAPTGGEAAGPAPEGRHRPGTQGPAPEARPSSGKELAPAGFFPPMLAHATSDDDPRVGPWAGNAEDWVFEPKLDGLRCIAVRNGHQVNLCSRNNLSFNARFPDVVKAVAALPATNFVLDGEIVALTDGRPDFGALQQGQAGTVEYRVFDMPWLLGQDLRHLPIEERKKLLSKAVPEGPFVKLVRSLHGDPGGLLERICQEGWEGLVAKRAGSPYREGRSGDWYKLKCSCRQELVIGGFTEPGGTRTGFGALLLGYWQQGELVYAGKVGTGFTQASLSQLRAQLAGLERPSCPFGARVVERGAHWVEPELVAEVAFSNWTVDGRLRHPSFLGLRPDKASADVVREECGPRTSVPGSRRRPRQV